MHNNAHHHTPAEHRPSIRCLWTYLSDNSVRSVGPLSVGLNDSSVQHILEVSPLFKSTCSVQLTTAAACGGLTVLTGHTKASGSQLRLWLQGEWLSAGLLRSNDIHIHPTDLKQWCFILRKPLNARVPEAWMMRSDVFHWLEMELQW